MEDFILNLRDTRMQRRRESRPSLGVMQGTMAVRANGSYVAWRIGTIVCQPQQVMHL